MTCHDALTNSNPTCCVILTTVSSEEEGKQLARILVSEKLAACVQLIPKVISFYMWQNSLEESQEWLLLIKTMDTLTDSVEKRLKNLHSYSVPQFIVFSPMGISTDYFSWIQEVLQ